MVVRGPAVTAICGMSAARVAGGVVLLVGGAVRLESLAGVTHRPGRAPRLLRDRVAVGRRPGSRDAAGHVAQGRALG